MEDVDNDTWVKLVMMEREMSFEHSNGHSALATNVYMLGTSKKSLSLGTTEPKTTPDHPHLTYRSPPETTENQSESSWQQPNRHQSTRDQGCPRPKFTTLPVQVQVPAVAVVPLQVDET